MSTPPVNYAANSEPSGFEFNEKYLSQIPALQQLINLGYQYLTPEQALAERGGRSANVILEGVLRQQLKKINRINYKGGEYLFSEENIQTAIQKLKNIKFDGLQKTNESIYDLITLGSAMEQTIEGDSKSFTLNYIDWKNPSNNSFHVVAEFSVERARSTDTVRPDIVLFVNGIPFSVIECKSPKVDVEQAVSQNIRNQGDDYIPRLFTYVQQVLAVNKNAAQYATAGTPKKFWGVWKEQEDKPADVDKDVNTALDEDTKAQLFSGEFAAARPFFDALEAEGKRLVTEQDNAIHSLCRPERLLDLVYRFTLFDGGIKKVARYQQYFVIKATIARIKRLTNKGNGAKENRQGGVIWHTQGSGKSLTMVMLTRAMALDPQLINPRIILVTDRDDLDKQLGNTFAACGLSRERATSGRNLVKHLKNKVGLITTLIHKFDKGWVAEKFVDESHDIFVLVDESHRTNFGSLAARMRQMLPNACFLGFTGTPLLKKEKNNFAKFGGLIEPHYTIKQAVADEAVLPLLYEGRHIEMEQNQSAIDLWFERHTADLSKEQKADLKKKYARAEMLNKADQVIYMRAFDISEHFRANWQGTGFKAQLVAPGKPAALKYQQFLQEIGTVTTEVVISGPDTREGHDEVDEGPTDEVGKFWDKMMKRFGSEEEYTKQIINQFKYGDDPEILIVVDKLLTGFDAPRNTVLYLCRTLREHTLLQAIARVNRLYEGKEFGYIIDYASVLGELDKALTMYEAFEGFDEDDLAGTLTSINEEVFKLPQRYSDLWDLFKAVKNSKDEEAYEVLLADDELREEFYECLSAYSKSLAIALSSEQFIMNSDEKKLQTYKNDLKRFQNLKAAVKLRYAEAIDYRDYEPKIKKLLDTHIQANEVTQLNEPVNIFDEKMFTAVKEEQGVYQAKTTASKADTIAHATKRSISENMDEDPAFYEKFSKLIQAAIDDFKAKRISDLEYLNRVIDIRNKVATKQHDDMPDCIRENDEACAYFGLIKPQFQQVATLNELDDAQLDAIAAQTSLAIQKIIDAHWKVDFWDDADVQKTAMNDIDDFLYDEVKEQYGVTLSLEQMDEIIEKTMQVAKHRRHS
ncbi:type I restriction enzyme, R subunit [Colwellia chukchiensis]|uniref:Type I restriction enzyme endonuclease subunit n=1 Tax=Colwellia chukchiensis TaxID=641665 RepID=A0A1H7PXB7_9GAMM|nr:HsdR family type I site-specific deoxyribonuclease [Colwellia chukchiensis]SEL40480.1 type I restriction enzyme, R subunit [Colwellia chukchiensis]